MGASPGAHDTRSPRGAAALRRHLTRVGIDDVVVDDASISAHSSDASLYRVRPLAIVRPRSADQVHEVVAFAQRTEIPIVARGAGTSVAGNAIGPGIVLDFSRHMDQILSIDPSSATARVQPGVVQANLQRAGSPHGLRFGPDPSTHTRCTIGGMIGNDACGARSLRFGRTSHNVAGLALITGTGDVLRTEATAPATSAGFDEGVRRLQAIVAGNLPVIRAELGRFDRQVSGYALHQLLPENGFNLTRALVGSEGTLGIVTEATVRLVPTAPHQVLVALGYASMIEAATDVPRLLEFGPTACEGLDARIVDAVRGRRGAAAVPELPAGNAWLFVEVDGTDAGEVLARARELATNSGADDARVVTDAAETAAIWGIRENGAGLAGRAPSGKPAYAGWEDAAVPPERLAAYLTDFESLTSEFGLTCMPFGHFGEGCIHVRLDFPFDRPDGSQVFRAFVERSADLVARHGGSLSGEHGDGRARSELLPRMYSADVLALFKAVKGLFDPQGIFNPGVMIAPDSLDDSLRVSARRPLPASFAMAFESDHGDLSQAVHRCTGVGRCRAVDQGPGRVMCPSYAATKEEIHSTRGRARVLQDLLEGRLEGGWRDPAVRDALDLCLSCKGCASDCPTGVDIAAYKAEATHQAYRRRLRPRSHYSLGWLPRWTRLAARAPSFANGLLTAPGVSRGLLYLAGVDGRRQIPRFAEQTFRAATSDASSPSTPGRPVLVFLDSFTNAFAPQVAHDLVGVLSDAGYSPTVTGPEVCCGLTWISTGQLDAARRILTRTVDQLVGPARDGIPIVGIEPSCTAVLRSDATELLATDDARAVAGATRTLAELLAETPGWEPPSLTGRPVVAQPHCHHQAVMGWSADRTLLQRAGADVREVGGCCGLAGNFGLERGHYDVSVAIAGLQLMPALDACPTSTVLADGFSCRTQIGDLASRPALHLAEILAGAGAS